jgi:16S rRNA (guanine1207-N2)-methyltransferase
LDRDTLFCVYGTPPRDCAPADWPADAVQVSPLSPGADALEDTTTETLAGVLMAAPAGTLERRYALALSLRALKPGARLTAMAPKDKGGSRLRKELESFGCAVEEAGRRHQRLCTTRRPQTAPALETAIEAAIEAGGPQFAADLGLWTQPGIFSWDRPDPGTQRLLATLPPLAGRGADLGCGAGPLAQRVLADREVTDLDLVDLDRRAVNAARRNINDPRAAFHWADVRVGPELEDLDFVVMNPPFHDAGAEDKALGQAFIRRAHAMLRKGGTLWLVANRHLPYEAVLTPLFAEVTRAAEDGGFKIYGARK